MGEMELEGVIYLRTNTLKSRRKKELSMYLADVGPETRCGTTQLRAPTVRGKPIDIRPERAERSGLVEKHRLAKRSGCWALMSSNMQPSGGGETPHKRRSRAIEGKEDAGRKRISGADISKLTLRYDSFGKQIWLETGERARGVCLVGTEAQKPRRIFSGQHSIDADAAAT